VHHHPDQLHVSNRYRYGDKAHPSPFLACTAFLYLIQHAVTLAMHTLRCAH
jgi:hypothetical protein